MLRRVSRPKLLRRELTVPGDKSITHRALILNAMSSGTGRILGGGLGADCLSTLACLRRIGVEIEEHVGGDITVHGKGFSGFLSPDAELDAGNSGTTLRLMSGLLAGLPFSTSITGDASLRSRPMGRIIDPLSAMGAQIRGHGEGGGCAPLVVSGTQLRGIEYRLPIPSAQVKSAVLLAGVNAEGPTTVIEPAPSRDHTERMLRAMGLPMRGQDGRISIEPGALHPLEVVVPGDISSAAFWLVAGCLHPDADVLVQGVGVNRTRAGVVEVLQAMGGDIAVEAEREVGGEPVADIRARSSALHGISISGELVPRIIDELPIVALAAALASGVTKIHDASELRVKETDRIATTATELRKMGVSVEELSDGLVVYGKTKLASTVCSSHGDHRLAMMLAVAGLVTADGVSVDGAEAAGVSYPGFWAELGEACNLL